MIFNTKKKHIISRQKTLEKNLTIRRLLHNRSLNKLAQKAENLVAKQSSSPKATHYSILNI